MGSRLKAVAVAGVAATALATMTAAAGAASEPSAPGDSGAPLEATARAYLKVYPQLSEAEARAAAEGQEARKKVYAALQADTRTLGGFWFDPPTATLHVATTTEATGDKAVAAGARVGVTVKTHRVARSFAQLEAQAAKLRAGEGALGKAARGQVGIDVKANKVAVSVPDTQVRAFTGATLPAGVTVSADPKIKTEEDAGCTSRAACDWTIRAGSIVWAGNSGNKVCSVGFTARNSSNQRYVYTAGHCSSGNGVTWGTGAISMGPMQASINSGALDAAIIRVTNSWFTGDLGGEIYNEPTAGKMVPVKGVAPTLSYIVQGETVCLSANYTQPNGASFCGVVGTNSDASVRGMVRVNGLDACPGDSGGGWYWLPSSGNRIAYGVHSRSDTGCHGSSGGSRSWFSALPTIKNSWVPSLNVETR
jgi:streptogrisin C